MARLCLRPCQVLVRARNTPRDCPASCGYGVMYCPSGVTHADGGQGRSGFRVRVLWAEHGPEQQSAAVVHRLSPEEFCKKVAEHLMGSYYWSQWMEVWAPDPATSETVAGAGGSGPARQVQGCGTFTDRNIVEFVVTPGPGCPRVHTLSCPL